MEHIRKKGIIGIIVCAILLVVLSILLAKQNWAYAFQTVKEVDNIVELNECQEGQWIRLKFNRAYETEYWYEEAGEKVAQFVDIEVNGKALIALIQKEEAEQILEDQTEEMYLEGVLQKFQGTDKEKQFNDIKENYLEDFSEELTEEEILDMFTPLQLLNYGVDKPNEVWIVALIIGSVIVGICFVMAIVYTVKPIQSEQDKDES